MFDPTRAIARVGAIVALLEARPLCRLDSRLGLSSCAGAQNGELSPKGAQPGPPLDARIGSQWLYLPAAHPCSDTAELTLAAKTDFVGR